MKRKRLSVLGVVAVLAVAGAAFAYWTSTGSGTGTGKVASSTGTITLHGVISNALTPGSTSPVTFTADNSGASSQQVGTVHAVVSTDKVGCEAEDFTIADTPENQVLAKESTGTKLENNGSITMADTAANQDACKGATITLTLTS
jgi:hypothetical protein